MKINDLPKTLVKNITQLPVIFSVQDEFKGELNHKIKLDLNDSFCTLINITLVYSNFAWFKRNF